MPEDPIIEMGFALNLITCPTLKRSDTGNITIIDRKYTSKEERLMTLLCIKTLGFFNSDITYLYKLRLARAATQTIAYDAGYDRSLGYSNTI